MNIKECWQYETPEGDIWYGFPSNKGMEKYLLTPEELALDML